MDFYVKNAVSPIVFSRFNPNLFTSQCSPGRGLYIASGAATWHISDFTLVLSFQVTFCAKHYFSQTIFRIEIYNVQDYEPS